MKHIKRYLIVLLLMPLLWSCAKEQLNPQSIFDTTAPVRNDFDKWLITNYTTPYNIEFKYKYDDKEGDITYNLVPAEYNKSVALAKLVKHLWMDAYVELKGKDFLSKYSPRMFHLIGSPAYRSDGSMVLATAEGGLKINMYNVNGFDPTHLDMAVLNEWYFKTIHHEFAHILNQRIPYSTDFNLISKSDYDLGGWMNSTLAQVLPKGFVSPYASSEPGEDFVEIIAIYVTNTQAVWNNMLTTAGASGATGAAKINQKFVIIKDYLWANYGIDINKLRDIVLRRSSEIGTLDLTSLN